MQIDFFLFPEQLFRYQTIVVIVVVIIVVIIVFIVVSEEVLDCFFLSLVILL